VLNAHEFNNPGSWKPIAAWKPDLIVTAGAPILRDPWLKMATHGCLNLHFGIAPDYRGEHTLFYPLLERQWDMLGLTIHSLDSGIDSGPILLRAYPALDGTEDEAAVWAKCSQLAARLLPEIVDDLFHGRVQSLPQNSKGRLIRYLDRSIWEELRLRYGRFTPPPRPERIERQEQ
jgi:methionyl-tRNA formyltransferase